MRAKKLLSSRQIFRYAVPARTVTKKALVVAVKCSVDEYLCTVFSQPVVGLWGLHSQTPHRGSILGLHFLSPHPNCPHTLICPPLEKILWLLMFGSLCITKPTLWFVMRIHTVTQNYNSVYLVGMICATIVSTRTDTQRPVSSAILASRANSITGDVNGAAY